LFNFAKNLVQSLTTSQPIHRNRSKRKKEGRGGKGKGGNEKDREKKKYLGINFCLRRHYHVIVIHSFQKQSNKRNNNICPQWNIYAIDVKNSLFFVFLFLSRIYVSDVFSSFQLFLN